MDLENDWEFDDPQYDHLTLKYLDDFIELIAGLDVPLTVFVVGQTLERYPEAVDRLDEHLNCEFHLHSYQHDTSKSYDFRTEIQRGVEVFRDHFGEPPKGYRAPQGNIEPAELPILEEEGFVFDSSVFPSYRPGVYNNLRAPLCPYVPETATELLEIPVASTPGTRIPIVHSYLKLFGRPYLYYLKHAPLPDVLVYNVHLQDLYRTASYNRLPTVKRHIYERNIDRTESLFVRVINLFRDRGYRPATATDLLEIEWTDQRLNHGERGGKNPSIEK
ncbi:polysaccharide deacetylase family protein [Natrialba swarupiae]|uniref:Polysaccharide deacetylase family protein n=1 Tax=Natrialba swarupiae TaxID=2448032 RepID=A0A5D5ANJ4_9EURY|nr:polysaccharide deacetylase family protein [Natrialba swarupiae]